MKKLENVTINVCKKGWKEFKSGDLHWDLPGTDLVYYPEVVMRYMDQEARGMIPAAMLKNFDMTEDEFLAAAIANMESEAKIMTIAEALLGEDAEELLESPDMFLPMLVLTNKRGMFGAGAMVSHQLLDKAREMLNTESIFILPCSTHEVLAIPDYIGNVNDLISMITDINQTTVREDEWLSDHPYIYDGYQLRTA